MSSSRNTKNGLRSASVKNAQNTPEGSDAAQSEEAPKTKKPSQHTWEGTYLLKKHKPGCVNRHVSWYAASNTCSHRGQARKRAQADFQRYLRDGDTSGDDAWDPHKKGNFQKSASTPFPHEAHHVVAAAELSRAIIKDSKGIEPEHSVLQMMRGGLLKEGYNVNDQVNMLILPMDVEATKRLGLPLHRTTPNHINYSIYIENLLEKAFSWLKKAAEQHEVPPYAATREKIEEISTATYPKIVAVGQVLKSSDVGNNDLESLMSRISKMSSSGKLGMKGLARPGSR